MLTTLRALTVGALLAVLAAGCSGGGGGNPTTTPTGPGGGRVGSTVALTTGTCWSDELAGQDPQYVLKLSKKYAVSYFAAAHALTAWPSFGLTQSCAGVHAVEVYKAVSMNDVPPKVSSYAGLLRAGTRAFEQLSLNVQHACMNKLLVDAAAQTGLRGALMSPAFPDDVTLGWAPPSEEQWNLGQRAYGCTLTQHPAGSLLYASVFSKAYPTAKRICIDNDALDYVDCARKHDRERIAILDLRVAVAAGSFPGHGAITHGSRGTYVNVSRTQFAALDRACTTYLHAVSTTTKLTGVSEIDPESWPAADGSYQVACEADAPPIKKSVTTQGSVFDR